MACIGVLYSMYIRVSIRGCAPLHAVCAGDTSALPPLRVIDSVIALQPHGVSLELGLRSPLLLHLQRLCSLTHASMCIAFARSRTHSPASAALACMCYHALCFGAHQHAWACTGAILFLLTRRFIHARVFNAPGAAQQNSKKLQWAFSCSSGVIEG